MHITDNSNLLDNIYWTFFLPFFQVFLARGHNAFSFKQNCFLLQHTYWSDIFREPIVSMPNSASSLQEHKKLNRQWLDYFICKSCLHLQTISALYPMTILTHTNTWTQVEIVIFRCFCAGSSIHHKTCLGINPLASISKGTAQHLCQWLGKATQTSSIKSLSLDNRANRSLWFRLNFIVTTGIVA